MYDTAKLIKPTYQTDENGGRMTDDYGIELPPIKSYCEIPVEVASCGQSEFFEANQSGFRPDMKLLTFCGNYSGQELAEYNGKVYKIYRTYLNGNGNIELYLTERVGVYDD